MRVFSPAKINLGLQVGHRRPQDGHHYISSLFVPISFGDELEIRPASKDRFSSENRLSEKLDQEEFERITKKNNLSANLVWRAMEKTRPFRSTALAVHLIKRIPLGSGLGGGSSNAGTLLKYILRNSLRKTRSSQTKLIFKIALELGADLPFFLHGRAMLVSGIGDILSPLRLGSGAGILSLGGVRVSTSQAYGLLKRPLQASPPPKLLYWLDENIPKALECSDWRALHALRNDFEGPIFSIHNELKQVKTEFLQEGADYALMSGSGSAVYALLKKRALQGALTKKMRAKFPSHRFIPFHF